jgi:EpsG family
MAAELASPNGAPPRPASLLASAFAMVALAVAAQTALAWLALAGLLTLMVARSGWLAWWPAVATALLLIVLNSLKWPESDLAEYFVMLDGARHLPLGALLDDESALLSIRSTEPVFRTLMWLLARADPLPRVAFTIFGGAAIYGSLLWLCRWASRLRHDDANWHAGVATAVALLVGVTFSLSGHLVRQYLAGGMFFLGVFGWALSGRWRWLLWPVAACATHNSALLLAAPLLLSMLFSARPLIFVAILLAALGAAPTGQIPILGDLSEATSFLKEDGQIGLSLPVLDGLLLLLAWCVWRALPAGQRPPTRAVVRILCFCVAFAVLLFYISEIPLLFFRSYFYLEFLRAPILAFVIAASLRRAGRAGMPLALITLPLAAFVCWLRVRSADWVYGATNARWPEWMDIHSVVQRWLVIQNTLL